MDASRMDFLRSMLTPATGELASLFRRRRSPKLRTAAANTTPKLYVHRLLLNFTARICESGPGFESLPVGRKNPLGSRHARRGCTSRGERLWQNGSRRRLGCVVARERVSRLTGNLHGWCFPAGFRTIICRAPPTRRKISRRGVQSDGLHASERLENFRFRDG